MIFRLIPKMNRLITAIVIAIFVLAGCSLPSKKTDSTAVKDVAAKKESVAEKETVAPIDVAEEKKAEPVVEVMARKQEEKPDLTLERLPEEKRVESEAVEEPDIKQAAEIAAPVIAEKQAASPARTEKKRVSAPVANGDFVVTVDKKDARHPFFGKGYPDGFSVDNVPGKELVLERGKAYSIVVDTNPKHDVYLSEKDIGWGSSVWTEGVEGMFTYKGTITFKPDNKAPNVIYYSCRNHPYMGGKIHIVNPGETVEITHITAKQANTATEKKTVLVSAANVQQKLLFANMLLNSGAATRVAESGIAEAIALQKQASQLIVDSERELKESNYSVAFSAAEKALDLLKRSSRLVPSDDEKQHLQSRHKELLTSISDYEKSHTANVKRLKKEKGADATVSYDKDAVEKLKTAAGKAAKAGDFGKANQFLEEAQNSITDALQKMLDSTTLVYDLKFETPKDEYEYELKRFTGYEELIPVAIEVRKPNEGAIQLMNQMLEKARKMRSTAEEKAGSGEHAVAIRMMLDATKTVRSALRMVGVMQ